VYVGSVDVDDQITATHVVRTDHRLSQSRQPLRAYRLPGPARLRHDSVAHIIT
jgi:hypothetical protein